MQTRAIELQETDGLRSAELRARGQVMGFLLVSAVLVTVVVCVLLGAEAVAGVLGGLTVVSIAGIFVTGRLPKEERKERRAE